MKAVSATPASKACAENKPSLTVSHNGEDFVLVPRSVSTTLKDEAKETSHQSSLPPLDALKELKLVRSPAVDFGKGQGTLAKGSSGIQLPPLLNLVMTHKATRRYNLGAGLTSADISVANLCQAAGIVAYSSSSAVAVHNAVRVLEVKIYTNVNTASTAASPGVVWHTDLADVKPALMDKSIPAGSTVGTVLTFKPPPRSLAAFWQTSTSTVSRASTNLIGFQNLGLGTVIDISCEWAMASAASQYYSEGTGSVYSSSAMSAGQLMYPRLDGPGGNMDPVQVVFPI